jgi:hypothetical protein
MERFALKSLPDFITINFEEVYGFPDTTCFWGGYEVRTTLEIKSGNFRIKATLWTSTGEIFEFYQKLKVCNDELKGEAYYNSYEGNLEMSVAYDNLGHINIKGKFSEQNQFDNQLQFNFLTDQTFIHTTVEELELIAKKYGNMKGIKR